MNRRSTSTGALCAILLAVALGSGCDDQTDPPLPSREAGADGAPNTDGAPTSDRAPDSAQPTDGAQPLDGPTPMDGPAPLDGPALDLPATDGGAGTDAAPPAEGGADVEDVPPGTLRPNPIERSVGTTLTDAVGFLYQGPGALQRGVTPGALDPRRIAALRGEIRERDGAPAPGVTVTVEGHPELGSTVTRMDGVFDLAVQGGQTLTVNLAREGRLPVQRTVTVAPQDWLYVPDTVLTAPDSRASRWNPAASTPQVLQGSAVTDPRGTRQATLIVPVGVRATVRTPGGASAPLGDATVRLTEFSAGGDPAAWPAEPLPGGSTTYGVELSFDEPSRTPGATVRLEPGAALYVNDFVGLPIGTRVPVGRWDRGARRWHPETPGIVLRVVDTPDGVASLDLTGDGRAEDPALLTSLGVLEPERRALGAIARAGQPFLRMVLESSGPYGVSWPVSRPPAGAVPPLADPAPCAPDHPSTAPGSVIHVEEQSLGEALPIAGTPFRLQYQSERVPGGAPNTVELSLLGATVPAGLQRVTVEVTVAGVRRRETLTPSPNLPFLWRWDGRDAFGRAVQGAWGATVRVGYVFTGALHAAHLFGSLPGLRLPGMTTTTETTEVRLVTTQLGAWDARSAGLGGWTLDAHHSYDPSGRALVLGDGERRGQCLLRAASLHAHVGTGTRGRAGDGGPALLAQLDAPADLALAPDGALYILELGAHRVRRVAPDGTIATVAGDGTMGFAGDGGPATAARLNSPQGLEVTADGALLIADTGNHRVRRVSREGTISTVAGTGAMGVGGDLGAATSAQLNGPRGLAALPDGSFFVADTGNRRIRQVAADGAIFTVAGTGSAPPGFVGVPTLPDGVPAVAAPMNEVHGLALGPDGSIYFTDRFLHRLRRIDPSGIVYTVAGSGSILVPGFQGEGVPGDRAQLFFPQHLEVARDGTVYVADANAGRVRMISPSGIVSTLAGGGGARGEGVQPFQAAVSGPSSVALAADGTVYFAEQGAHRVRRLRRTAMPGPGDGATVLPSDHGDELYHFDARGRHTQTVDARTGAVRYRFTYEPSGALASVADADGNTTTIERAADGSPRAIVGPYGHRTALTLDDQGWLASMVDPAAARWAFTYTDARGLLATATSPSGGTSRFVFDDRGRLTEDTDPAGGRTRLARSLLPTGARLVQVTSPAGRVTRHERLLLPNGAERRDVTDPAGLHTTTEVHPDGAVSQRFPDGREQTLDFGPDPRFGSRSPRVEGLSVTSPGRLRLVAALLRTVVLARPEDPLSLTRETLTRTVNGRDTVETYDHATRTSTVRSPLGRLDSARFDALGHVIEQQRAGTPLLRRELDPRGRLLATSQGDRRSVQTWNAQGQVETLTDPEGRLLRFTYDPVGRVLQRALPGSRDLAFAWDAAGRLSAVTPPGRAATRFAYTPLDLLDSVTFPDAGEGPAVARYRYDADRKPTAITRPDGEMVTFGYDAAGRLSTTAIARGVVRREYDAMTGALSRLSAPGGQELAFLRDGPLALGETSTGAFRATLRRTYNNDLALATETVEGTPAVAFTYDRDGRVTRAGALNITREAATGREVGTDLGVVTTAATYDAQGEPASLRALARGAGVLEQAFTRDRLGRVTRVVETAEGRTETRTYTYDPAGRLSDVSRDGGPAAHYEYDSNGNRTLARVGPAEARCAFDAQDRLQTCGEARFAYTAAGDLRTRTEAGRTTTYAYDALGNLLSVALPDGRRVEYVIDGLNRRVGRRVDGRLTQGLVYRSRLQVAAEVDGAGAVVARFVYGSSEVVPDYMLRDGATFRLVADTLGSVRAVVNTATGEVAQRLDYDASGNVLRDTRPGFVPFGFAGGLYDQDTGLLRFGARDYDPRAGRWTARDPRLFDGSESNLYGYVSNDPVNRADPDGEADLPVIYARGVAYAQAVVAGARSLFLQLYVRAAMAITRQDPARLAMTISNLPDNIVSFLAALAGLF
ncbi:MAG: hypothetical protein HY909_24405 [Deltaproteobacteria bacterium]|nr:hypothetical protein [Deltaproteobacteria bacterium]